MRLPNLVTLGTALLTAVAAATAVASPLQGAGVAPTELTADEIVERNIAARGGLEAWRTVETMVCVGHLQKATGPAPLMSFVMEQKRPNKTRLEVTSMGHRSLRVFDGTRGWKLHPGRDGKPQAESFSNQELAFARDAPGLEGVLMDHQAKGVVVALDGLEMIDGRKTYRLRLQPQSGEIQKVWIDAQSFLEARYDRMAHDAVGAGRMISLYYGDYRNVDGRQIPHLLEIGAGSAKAADRMTIERLTLNAPLSDRLFALSRSAVPANAMAQSASGLGR
jgi:hypothetical protein